MKILKKIIGYDDDLSKTANLLQFLFRAFTYIIPLAIFIWCFVIENAMSKEIGIWTKIGCGGIVVLIIVLLFLVHFVKKSFNKKISKLADKILMCTDETHKLELIKQKRKLEGRQELFGNICLIVPFIVVLMLVNMIETQLISLRGILFAVVISMIIGLVFNIFLQQEKVK